MIRSRSDSWAEIFKQLSIDKHNFDESPFEISATQIKGITSHFGAVHNTLTEPRCLCKQDRREERPEVFKEKGLFILPIKNGFYKILKGDGYVDIPPIESEPIEYESKLNFTLDTSKIGDSEMQYLDKAYASSIIRTFMNDPSLVLTIRGRKYTPSIDFRVGSQSIHAESVQTEVDAGYEGENEVVLIEAKNSNANNTIIRQLYYPYRQWQAVTNKKVKTLFFEHDKNTDYYNIWEFTFENPDDYSSIKLVKSARFKMPQ